jgi:hypothetical protein
MPDFAGCDPVAAQACFGAAPGKRTILLPMDRLCSFQLEVMFFQSKKSIFFTQNKILAFFV